jgi:hypothetical protein
MGRSSVRSRVQENRLEITAPRITPELSPNRNLAQAHVSVREALACGVCWNVRVLEATADPSSLMLLWMTSMVLGSERIRPFPLDRDALSGYSSLSLQYTSMRLVTSREIKLRSNMFSKTRRQPAVREGLSVFTLEATKGAEISLPLPLLTFAVRRINAEEQADPPPASFQ